jgi:hypothetical protein
MGRLALREGRVIEKPTDRALHVLARAMSMTAGSNVGLCSGGWHRCDLQGAPEGVDVWPPFEEGAE